MDVTTHIGMIAALLIRLTFKNQMLHYWRMQSDPKNNERSALVDLLKRLSLERLDEYTFRGESHDLGWGSLFGGHVLGQALSAASHTVPPERLVHSLHAYFLQTGRVDTPIEYTVEPLRDGRSFLTRRITASQANTPIFTVTASFHADEFGLEHQVTQPDAPRPGALIPERQLARNVSAALPEKLKKAALGERAIELRPVDPVNPFDPKKRDPKRMVWYRANGPVSGGPSVHRSLLAYASDFSFITTALQPHGVSWLTPGIRMSSLDHSMWFHRPFRMDQWLLHVMESPSAHGARGFVRGQIFDESGNLVASTAQEGVIRLKAWRDREE